MIKFVFILAILLPSGELEVGSRVLDKCPDKALFTAQMETKRIHGEILNWRGRCYELDIQQMLGSQS
jgi:hypothetical protein